jgi:hypothetical protein
MHALQLAGDQLDVLVGEELPVMGSAVLPSGVTLIRLCKKLSERGSSPVVDNGNHYPATSKTTENATMAQDTCQQCPETSQSQRAGEGTRTPNLLFTRQLRYRLRHASMTTICP